MSGDYNSSNYVNKIASTSQKRLYIILEYLKHVAVVFYFDNFQDHEVKVQPV